MIIKALSTKVRVDFSFEELSLVFILLLYLLLSEIQVNGSPKALLCFSQIYVTHRAFDVLLDNYTRTLVHVSFLVNDLIIPKQIEALGTIITLILVASLTCYGRYSF